MPKKEKLILKFQKLTAESVAPTKAYTTDACYDLYTIKKVRLASHEIKKIPTGIAFEIPTGYFGKVYERSGVASDNNLIVKAGVIDSDYRGEVSLIVENTSSYPIVVESGTKMAQMAIHQIPQIELKEVKELSKTERGENGFGSSGK